MERRLPDASPCYQNYLVRVCPAPWAHALLVDGAVKFLPEDMDTGLLKTLTTTGGDEKDTGILKDAGMSVPLNH